MSRRYADTAFEDFWIAYPRKVGKLAAKREWDRIRPTPELILKIAESLAWQIETWEDHQFIPHPRTWLHQGRWDDEPEAVKHTKAWLCPHLDPCAHRAMCDIKNANILKYPRSA